jgi:hypothetical protein
MAVDRSGGRTGLPVLALAKIGGGEKGISVIIHTILSASEVKRKEQKKELAE